MSLAIASLLNNFDYEKAYTWYRLHAPDSFVKKMLASGPTKYNIGRLKEELGKLDSVWTEKEAEAEMKKELKVEVINPKLERKYSFDKSHPEEIVQLNKEWKRYYGEKNFLRGKLTTLQTDEERKICAKKIIELRNLCAGIWFKLDYYQEHKTLPIAKQEFTIENTSIELLIKRRGSIKTYLSKSRIKKLTEAKIKAYQQELEAINKIIEKHAIQ